MAQRTVLPEIQAVHSELWRIWVFPGLRAKDHRFMWRPNQSRRARDRGRGQWLEGGHNQHPWLKQVQ